MQKKKQSIIAKHLPIIIIVLIIFGLIYYMTSNASAIAMGSIAIITAHLIMIGFALNLGRKLFNKRVNKQEFGSQD